MPKPLLRKLVKYGLCLFLVWGTYYVGTRLEFQDPFVPTPIYKGLKMTQAERQANPLEAVSLTKEAVLEQYKITKAFVEVLDKHGVVHWLASGSLLGAVRHQGIIPYDDDVDFFIQEEDGEKLLALKDDLKSVGIGIYQDRSGIKAYKLDGLHVRPKGKSFKILPGVWMVRRKKERFPVIDIYTTREKNGEIVYANYRARRRTYPKKVFPKGEVFPLKDYQFGPLKLKGPKNPNNFLKSAYGRDWDKFLVFKSNHSYNLGFNFKLPLTEKLKMYCHRYGVEKS